MTSCSGTSKGRSRRAAGSKCGSGSSNCYAFQTPPSYAAWLKNAGFTIMNLANNHAYDYGPSGQSQTLAALAGQRLAHTGRPGEIAYAAGRRDQSGGRRLRTLSLGAEADGHPGRTRLVKKAAARRRRRHRDDACGRRGNRPHARTPRNRDVPRREPRQRGRVLARRRRRRRRRRHRPRPARPAGEWSGTRAG